MNKVGLVKRVATPAGRRFCPVLVAANGRISPTHVLVNGQKAFYPEGTYYLEWWEGPSRKRAVVGRDASQAQAARMRKEAVIKAQAQGIVLPDEPVESASSRTLISQAVKVYLADVALLKKPKTLSAYTNALEYFRKSCRKQYVDEIERRDMLRFSDDLRTGALGVKQSPRTVWNKFAAVMFFIKAQGIRGLVSKNDWPNYTEDEPEVYEQDELDAIYDESDASTRLLWKFFLMTGMRDQEVIYCTWADINLNEGYVSVRYKDKYGWSPKNYRGREIPVPDSLIERLREKKESTRPKEGDLVFPTRNGKPNHKMLLMLKRIAVNAGLDPEKVWLHKFRATFCTWHLDKGGLSLATAQMLMGHKDIKSTMRYWRAARGKEVKDKINATFS